MVASDTTAGDAGFAAHLLAWFDEHGRHDLPWQHPRTPYRVWVSEIMLQQTQVQTVVGYFQRFVARFPDLPTLAAAQEDEVLALWSGLGYYQRARNLHRSARICVERHGEALPNTIETLSALPGLGRSTAAAILAQAHGQRHAILDANVKRVLARRTGEHEWSGRVIVARRLWAAATARLPELRIVDYTQALMDFGATLCTPRRPRCDDCPVQTGCVARSTGTVERIPVRKPARVLPRRAVCMFVLLDNAGRVLLERRSGKGVWQGLWSLPESENKADTSALSEALGAAAETPLPAFTHTFSHYRLDVQPTLYRVHDAAAFQNAAQERRWVARGDYDAIGLPSPIRHLLESLP